MRQNTSDCVGEDEGPADNDVDDPEVTKLKGDDLKKAKGFVNPFLQEKGVLQLVPEPPYTVAESMANPSGSRAVGVSDAVEYMSMLNAPGVTLRTATWNLIDPHLDSDTPSISSSVPGSDSCQVRATVDGSVTHAATHLQNVDHDWEPASSESDTIDSQNSSQPLVYAVSPCNGTSSPPDSRALSSSASDIWTPSSSRVIFGAGCMHDRLRWKTQTTD
jgi:hypothetical protein